MRSGQLETQLAMDDLLERAEHEEWTRKARFVMSALCRAGVNFTAESVRDRMLEAPPEPNLMGAVFRAAANEGWIQLVGYARSQRPDAHGRMLALWRSA